jgi:hypothetical protein
VRAGRSEMQVSKYATVQHARRGMARGLWPPTLNAVAYSAYVSKHAATREARVSR